MNLAEWRSTGSFLDVGGLNVFHHREGAGETLLCLHGFPASSFDYHKIWNALTEHFETIAFDMIGYGYSSKPTNWGYTTFDQANVLEAVLKQLKIGRVHI